MHLKEALDWLQVLFYIAYMREFSDPVSGKSHPCADGNCLPELQTQLMVVFTGKTMGKQITYTLKPFIFKWKNSLMANKHAKKALSAGSLMPAHLQKALQSVSDGISSATGGILDDPTPKKSQHKQRSHAESEVLLMPFQGTFDDFCDRVIQYGYLVLFAPAFPLAPFLAFINNVIEIRTSGYKFCRGIQRPTWRSEQGIGSWFVVLNVLGFMAVLTNASMITFVGDYNARNADPPIITTGFLDRTEQWQLWKTFFMVRAHRRQRDSGSAAILSAHRQLSYSLPARRWSTACCCSGWSS